MIKAADIIEFEEEIAQLYKDGKIKGVVHLRSGNEEQLIEIFKEIRPQDHVFNYWASHAHALLKGIPREQVKQRILDGYSISLCFPEYNFYCSGILGSLCGVALGVAFALKKEKSDAKAYLFVGDMQSHLGLLCETIQYAYNHELPLKVIVENNGFSVLTPTLECWDGDPWWVGTKYESIIQSYTYENGYAHNGIVKGKVSL